ncbi:MAG: PIN domain-containing protein [Planctomycetaceae bacterium]
MKKPTIYLDTNIVSALHYIGTDINTLSRRMATRDWWDSERRHFDVVASSFTELELAAGQYPGQASSVRFVRRLPYVPITRLARNLADELLEQDVIPAGKRGDAMQLALAAAHEFDYLLTWNYAHLANPLTQARAERLFAKCGCRAPLLVSPETIPQVKFNKTIRR